MSKLYSFWFHYNKPESKSRGINVLTVHYKGQCILVEGIECNVPIKTKNRKDQPRCVMTGKGILKIENEIAIINGE